MSDNASRIIDSDYRDSSTLTLLGIVLKIFISGSFVTKTEVRYPVGQAFEADFISRNGFSGSRKIGKGIALF
jgi:uncharacterized Fe-S cluster-containing MiaB family protein